MGAGLRSLYRSRLAPSVSMRNSFRRHAAHEREERPLLIVDSQIHLWKEETPDRPWVPGARERIRLNGYREEAFLAEEAISLMDEAGINRALIRMSTTSILRSGSALAIPRATASARPDSVP